MRTKHLRDLTLAALACIGLAACGDKPGDRKTAEPHSHKAPHKDGEILELDGGKVHLELIHDHEGGKVVVYVYGSDFDKKLSVERPTVTILMQDKKTQADVPLAAVEPNADGTSHSWKGEHAGLIADPWNGRISVKIAGKEHTSALEDPKEHTHDK